ncbi:DC-STAMP domain-containing protein 2 isoform X1 [Gallus gallus]|uniref:DC-STAMP domain-containing protein 2 isoform X1 n=1 Tax=Gallus gallus TaxID=9031 RepID=UPI001F00C3BC|nr:DC-STAMP domain-containing protein 2 isoform X1 [Gallus gallus]
MERLKRWLWGGRAEELSGVQGVVRSTAGFALGMGLAALYGALVLLVQRSNAWFCWLSSAVLGAVLGLGMAFSIKVRLSVLLTLPHVFTREGKILLLLLALGMAVQGPCTNVLHNFARVAESVACGAELALNQTAERMQRAREPLLNVLSKIKDIAQKAKVVGDRVRKFFRAIIDGVTHVARALRNVWLWLSNVGDVCNREMGTPFHRCLRLFSDAKDNCERALSFLFFLCYIIITFKPLCGLASIGLLFCIIPMYIQSFLRRVVAEPINRALDRLRREFEFNISVSHHFDVTLNSSKTLADVAMDIMEGVARRLQPTRQLLGLSAYVSSCAILYMYLQALRYRYRYLRDDTFDNVYITGRFVQMDAQRAQVGRPTVLPLSIRESSRYIHPGMPWLSQQERQRYGLELTGFLRYVLLGLSLVLADYSLFWLLDLVRHQMQGEIVARAPAVLAVSVEGSGYTSDIYRDVVSSFDVLQRGNVSVLSQRCLVQPVEPDYGTYISMGILYGICFFIALCGSHVARLRRVVCAAYYPTREQERTVFLYNRILARRKGLVHALHRAARQSAADAGGSILLRFLGSRVPGFTPLLQLLGTQQKCCLACGAMEQKGLHTCITVGCKGLYCSQCYATLNNVCSVCMGPLSYKDMGDEEIDSSDEETPELWLGALRALRGQEQQQLRDQGRQLEESIRRVVRGRGGGRRLPPKIAARLRAQLEEKEEERGGDDDDDVGGEDSSASSLDFSYQEQPEGSGSELEEVRAERPHGRTR